MSTKPGVSDAAPIASGESAESSEYVSREAHDRLLAQRKKDQARAVAAEQERDRLKAEADEREQKQLADQKRFEDLWGTEKKAREAAQAQLASMAKERQDEARRNALSSALGGVAKQEYLRFAKLDAIQVGPDGSIDPDSVKEVAAHFRAQYPELLPTQPAPKLPGGAARDPKPADPNDLPIADLWARFNALNRSQG